jgi:hypothetical protein
MFWFHLQLLSETFLILIRTGRDMIKNMFCSSRKVRIFVRCQWNLNFLDRFSKNSQISNSMNNRSAGAELLHADGRTDMHGEIDSRFSQFWGHLKVLGGASLFYVCMKYVSKTNNSRIFKIASASNLGFARKWVNAVFSSRMSLWAE